MRRFSLLLFILCKGSLLVGQNSSSNDCNIISHSKFIRNTADSFFKLSLETTAFEFSDEIGVSDFLPKDVQTSSHNDLSPVRVFKDDQKSNYTVFYKRVGNKLYLEVMNNQVLDTKYPAIKQKYVREKSYQKLKKSRKGLRFVLELNNTTDKINSIVFAGVYYD